MMYNTYSNACHGVLHGLPEVPMQVERVSITRADFHASPGNVWVVELLHDLDLVEKELVLLHRFHVLQLYRLTDTSNGEYNNAYRFRKYSKRRNHTRGEGWGGREHS